MIVAVAKWGCTLLAAVQAERGLDHFATTARHTQEH